MKEIKAIVQPFVVEEVLRRLETEEIPGLTLSEVRGWGRTRAANASEIVHEAGHAFARKTKIEIVVADVDCERVMQVIADAARTGSPGDGKIFVYPVESALRIRTGERSDENL